MASTAAPYGFKPVKRVDGMPYAGAVEEFLIDPAGEGTNIFNGSIVAVGADGYIALVTDIGSDSDPMVAYGVFVGCEYTNAQGQRIWSQYYPSGTTGDVRAKVVTDPMVVFQVQADGAMAQTNLGNNVYLAEVQSTSTGSTQTGNSDIAVDASTAAATSGFAFRVVGFASAATDAAPDLLVKFNPGSHAYTRDAGI